MGRAKRARAERRKTLQRLQQLAFEGDPDAFTLANAWHVLPAADRATAGEQYDARKRVLAYRAAGAPYGDHEQGYRRWCEEQGPASTMPDGVPDWWISTVFDAVPEGVARHLEQRRAGRER